MGGEGLQKGGGEIGGSRKGPRGGACSLVLMFSSEQFHFNRLCGVIMQNWGEARDGWVYEAVHLSI